ncbi:MAG: CAP domain-containing protein [Myxococcota bacterium]
MSAPARQYFALVLSLGCLLTAPGVASADPGEARTGQSLGEPRDGYPSYAERVVLYLTNRARTEPDAFNPDEPYEPTPPLQYDRPLSQAARWQAQHIIEGSCWCADHSSCCELTENADGEVVCAGEPTGCGMTSSTDRVSLWSARYSGENAALGQQSAQQAVDGWIHSSGHWQNMNGSHSLLGVGRFQTAWVQDFGSGGTPPVAADGIHLRSGQQHTFGTTYYQPTTGGPQSALVIVDGTCHELDLAYGEPELGAFETTLSLESGCHRYYFHITDGAGDYHTYPDEGSFAVDVGADSCPFFSTNRPADTCSPSGQTCETGHTRPCYTGPFGTEGVGVCRAGTERCIGGTWTGECNGQTLPADAEICENELDDNCDGQVDEGCGVADVGELDAGDAGESDDDPSNSSGGCGTAAGAPAQTELIVVLLVALCVFWRRRATPPKTRRRA